MQNKIVVLGGSGFIGSEICRLGALLDLQVVSVSRKGKPQDAGEWADKVEWVSADALEPEKWAGQLAGSRALIHCVSVILGGADTFQRVNVGTAKVVAEQADKAGVPKVVYLSVNEQIAMLPIYFQSKRQAEKALQGHNFELAILRPGLVYGPRRAPTELAGTMLKTLEIVPVVGGLLRRNTPLSVKQVAAATLHAALKKDVQGILNVETLEKLATKSLKNAATQ
jgi:NADH dehydrogenase